MTNITMLSMFMALMFMTPAFTKRTLTSSCDLDDAQRGYYWTKYTETETGCNFYDMERYENGAGETTTMDSGLVILVDDSTIPKGKTLTADIDMRRGYVIHGLSSTNLGYHAILTQSSTYFSSVAAAITGSWMALPWHLGSTSTATMGSPCFHMDRRLRMLKITRLCVLADISLLRSPHILLSNCPYEILY